MIYWMRDPLHPYRPQLLLCESHSHAASGNQIPLLFFPYCHAERLQQSLSCCPFLQALFLFFLFSACSALITVMLLACFHLFTAAVTDYLFDERLPLPFAVFCSACLLSCLVFFL